MATERILIILPYGKIISTLKGIYGLNRIALIDKSVIKCNKAEICVKKCKTEICVIDLAP